MKLEFTDAKLPVGTNAVVDPSAAKTDPTHSEFEPQTRTELTAAIENLTQGTRLAPPDAFKVIKKALQKGEEDMNQSKLESIIRKQIRKQIKALVNEVTAAELRAQGVDVPAFLRDDQEVSDTLAAKLTGGGIKVPAGASGNPKAEKFKRDLSKKLEKAEFPEDVAPIDWNPMQEKIEDILAELMPEVIGDFSKRLTEMVSEYNDMVGSEKKFNAKPVGGMTSLVNGFRDFMSHVADFADGDAVSAQAMVAFEPKFSKFYSLMRSPQRVFYDDKGKFNSKIRPLGQPLAKWMHEAAAQIKKLEAFRRADSTTKIGINEKTFTSVLEAWFEGLNIDMEKRQEVIDAMVDAANEGSPSAKTNLIAEKLMQTAFVSTWEQALDSIGFSDWFAETEESLENRLGKAVASHRVPLAPLLPKRMMQQAADDDDDLESDEEDEAIGA